MPGNNQIALAIEPLQLEGPLSQYAKVAQVGNMIRQGREHSQRMEQRDLQIDKLRRDAADEENWRGAYTEGGGDPARTIEAARKRGVQPKTIQDYQRQFDEEVKRKSELKKLDFDNTAALTQEIFEAHEAVARGAPEQRPQLYDRATQDLLKRGRIKPEDVKVYDPVTFDVDRAVVTTQANAIKQAAEQRAQADAKRAEAKEKHEEAMRPAQEKRAASDALAAASDASQKAKVDAGMSETGVPAKAPTGELAEFKESFYPGYLQSKGITKPTAKDEMEALGAFHDSKRERVGGVPGVDIPLPPAVEEQRNRMNAARAQRNGLSPQQLDKANRLASQLDANPTVKDFKITQNKVMTVKGLLDRGLGGPGDLAIVFETMKGLDPTSVVRESEYATAVKSGNIFAGALAKFNGYLKPEGGFLPPQVKSAFLKILEEKQGASKRQVQGLYKDFGRRIDKTTGKNDGTEYLTDYTSILADEVPSGAGPAVGTVEGGYKFKGGNPADKSNWEKQ